MVTFYWCINIQSHDHVSLFCYCIISLYVLCVHADGIMDTLPFVVANFANNIISLLF